MAKLLRVVIVGASLAGLRAAETLRAEGFDGDLTLVGEESNVPYDRPPLSKEILVGDMEPEEVALPVREDFKAQWHLGETALTLDTDRRIVTTSAGNELPYDGLVIATGSAPRKLPGLEPDGDRILDLRTLDDAMALRGVLARGARLLVVGCGFIGVEVAAAGRQMGVETTVVSLDPPLLPAGRLASDTALGMLVEHGVDLRIGRTVAALARSGVEHLVTLDDESEVQVDVIVVAIGAIARVDWLEGSALHLDDGIVCDGALRALKVEGVTAAGDVARWPNPLFGGMLMRIEHWSNAIEQGAAAARTLLRGATAEPFSSLPSFWSDHFGTRLQSVGLPGLAEEFRVTDGTWESGRYAAAAYRHGCLVGAVAYGMPKALVKLRAELTRTGVDVNAG